jgi:uncharacterized protein YaaQ
MKLIFAIINDEDSPRLISEINRSGQRVTKLNSTGGFLRSGNTTLMAVVEDELLEKLLGTIRKFAKSRKAVVNSSVTPSVLGGTFMPLPVEVQIGGATVFVVNVEHFEKI